VLPKSNGGHGTPNRDNAAHPGHQYISREGGGAASPERDLLRFIHDNKINVLNVAGPRASEEPEVVAFVKEVFDKVWAAP
jgi:hypothetical protein